MSECKQLGRTARAHEVKINSQYLSRTHEVTNYICSHASPRALQGITFWRELSIIEKARAERSPIHKTELSTEMSELCRARVEIVWRVEQGRRENSCPRSASRIATGKYYKSPQVLATQEISPAQTEVHTQVRCR